MSQQSAVPFRVSDGNGAALKRVSDDEGRLSRLRKTASRLSKTEIGTLTSWRSKHSVAMATAGKWRVEGEILKGHLDMIVMAALSAGPAHGYEIIQTIRARTAGEFDLPEGTVYPVLHRLELAGLLNSSWTIAETGRKRRVYALTRRGEGALQDRQAVWRRFTKAVGGLLEGAEYAPG